MKTLKLGNRLAAAAEFVRSGAVCADIGTDHAYIPIYLALNGISDKILASDINEGPILSAKENIEEYGLSDIIETRIANGLDGIENFAPTDILICGMGGELIAQIIQNSDYVKNENIRLILQPMTSIKELRKYLQNGFSTVAENIALDSGKIYQIICVHYDGQAHNLTDTELEIGHKNIETRGELFEKLLFSTIAKKAKKRDGLLKGGYDTSDIDKEIKELEKLI